MSLAELLQRLDRNTPEFKLLAAQEAAVEGFAQPSEVARYMAGRTDLLTIRREAAFPFVQAVTVIP